MVKIGTMPDFFHDICKRKKCKLYVVPVDVKDNLTQVKNPDGPICLVK